MRIRRMIRCRIKPSDDTGAVAVFVTLLAVIMLVMAAFAVDIGNAYANGRQLSVAADSAALSAAAAVGEKLPYGATCDSAALASINAQTVAQTAADNINRQNNRTGQPEPVNPVTVSCTSTYVQVSVDNSRQVNTRFAGIVGVNSLTPNAAATARYVRVPTTGGLRPWAVCDATVMQAQQNPNQTFATWLDNKSFGGTCNSDASGNWGAVDMDGGNNAAGDLADWTLTGYPGAVVIPNPVLPADPGVSNSNDLRDAFMTLVGQVVLFPSVTGISGGGNNAKFDAVGIVTAKVCGIRYGNNTYNTGSDCWDPVLAAATKKSNGQLVDHIQFRWVNYTTSSFTGSNPTPCDFTNRQCVGSTLLWK